ncbi:MAG TPA: pyridoxal phosphate-dependent aminotransferase [Firmicutes bacterium]|nr:pyridoxal phosphate-dependent aminotransferase [Bacillota bacterium]
MRLAERLQNLGTENAFEVLAEVNKLVAQGRHIVSFAIGEPDFNTPENIKEAAIAALHRNETHYGPSAGLPALRQAIAAEMSRTRGIPVSPDEVVVVPGGKPIIFHGLLALVDPGDEVLYPNPGFPIYESVIRFLGGKAVPIPLREEREFSLDPAEVERLITPRTKLIILNSPHNPTGGIIPPEDLAAVAELAKAHDLWVLSDEVYSRILFEGEFHSIASLPGMKERTIILDGFSKTYAMTGWRLGYGVMPAELAVWVARLETNCESCTCTFTQLAGVEALTGDQSASEAMVAEFRARRDLIVDGLNAIRGVKCLKPHGAFYVYPNVTEACRNLGLPNAKALQEKLLYEGNVAVLPRSAFGRRNDGEREEYLRLSYATSRENIVEGLARIKAVLEG